MARGFVESPLQPMTLMMTIGTIRDTFSERERILDFSLSS